MHLIKISRLPALVLALMLAACGGGGGDSSSGGTSGSTGGGGNSAGPTVTATSPLNTANGAGLRQDVVAIFSQPLDAATVNVGSFTLTGPNGPVNGTVGLFDQAAHFTPTAPLAFDTEYTARVTTAIKDTAGHPLAADVVWHFNTGKKIVAGGFHTCARFDDGRIKCWGLNNYGQLGLGDPNSRGDQANEMGDNLPVVNLGRGRTAVELALGRGHSCARLDDGQVKCWGDNSTAQLGLGDIRGEKVLVGDQANEMGDNLPSVDLGSGRAAVRLAAGAGHTCALLDNGQIKCWGGNSLGQLGLGDRNTRGDEANEMGDHLSQVDLGTGHKAVQLAAGYDHTCALLDNGQVKCWGSNATGQLGLGDKSGDKGAIGDQPNEMGDHLAAVDMGSGRTAVQLVSGDFHTCVLLDNGQVKCWGENDVGQAGLGDRSGDKSFIGDQPNEMGDNLPAVEFGTILTHSVGVLELVAGRYHTCARLIDPLTQASRLKCWGYNNFGQLGLGDSNNRGDQADEMGDKLPAVNLGRDRTALTLAGGVNHTCALLDNGEVKCWGSNVEGELGLGVDDVRGDGPNEMGDNLSAVDLGR